jgi:transposase
MKISDARQLSPDAQEDLRRRCVEAVLEGMTQTAAAALFQVARGTVNRWVALVRAAGEDALTGKPRGGDRRSKLTATQAASIVNTIRDHNPDQLKLPFYLWTREAVQRLIGERLSVEMDLTTVGRYLEKWGFTAKKPMVRACQRNEERVRRWLEEEYPDIVARARREGARIWWGDETGLKSRHHTGTSFSPRGQTPVVRATGKVFGCNIVSAITNQGHLAFMVYESSFNAATFHEFLTRLLLESPDQKVFLILDNLRVHRAKVLQPWLAQNKDRIELFFLPPYSPDLNPDELLNHDLKANAVGRKRARTKDELIDNATSHLESRKATPAVISNLFREKHVRYAA